jgi:hypothetical protein
VSIDPLHHHGTLTQPLTPSYYLLSTLTLTLTLTLVLVSGHSGTVQFYDLIRDQ